MKQMALRKGIVFTFISHIIALILLSLIAFGRNYGLFFAGNDGPTNVALAKEQLAFYGMTPHLHSNFLQGLANLSAHLNLTLQPGYWMVNYHGNFALVLLYTWFATQVFLSVLLIGWNYAFSSRICYAAAWLLTLLMFPYFTSFQIYTITAASPYFITILLVFAVLNIAITHIGNSRWQASLGYLVLLLGGIASVLIWFPANLMLLFPVLLATTLHTYLTTSNKTILIRKTALLVVAFLLCVVMGWVEYSVGLILNTAASFFKTEMGPSIPPSLEYVSLLFQGQIADRPTGPWLFCFSVMGCFVAMYASRKFRSLAMTVLGAQLFIVGLGALGVMFINPWVAPSPVYFEVVLFPFYALFTCYFFAALFSRILPTLMAARVNSNLSMGSYFLLVIMVIAVVSIQPKRHRIGFALHPTSTVLTDILENEIGLANSDIFAGRVVSLHPHQSMHDQFCYAAALDRLIGNDHQTTGLWLKSIPTLNEYNPLITPGFYTIYRQLLSDRTDLPDRNWTSFNVINLKVLKLLGVRFILSTTPVINGAVQRAVLVVDKDLPPLRLFEQKGANTAGISATKLLYVDSVNDAKNALAADNFDLQKAIVIHHSLMEQASFVPVITSSLKMGHGGLHLQAESKGKTLLILPVEYSHCLQMKTLSGVKPKIMRVDIALAGVLFDRKVDVMLDNHTGLFANPGCRMQDYREFTALWKGSSACSSTSTT